jgi:hypothetical protein
MQKHEIQLINTGKISELNYENHIMKSWLF